MATKKTTTRKPVRKPVRKKVVAKKKSPAPVIKKLVWGERLVGVHASTQGGVVTGIKRGDALGCTAIQIFTKNNSRWHAAPFTQDETDDFLDERDWSGIRCVLGHASYLINLASGEPKITEQSMEAMRDEMHRAESLELTYLVLHPGAHKGDGDLTGIRRVADRLNILFEESVFQHTRILLEGTAGQGTSLGHRFEHLRDILAGVRDLDRVGICLDTAHLFAAGYDFRTPTTYAALWDEFERVVGRRWLAALHLNDTTKKLGSRVDRHHHIGQGQIGVRAFGLIMRDPRLTTIPMICETPKGPQEKFDAVNLAKLHGLMG